MSEGKPRHLNGCGECPPPEQPKPADDMTREDWKAHAKASEAFTKKSRIYWFKDGRGYLELCEDHWAEVRAFLTNKTLEAFG